jgi:hypothetical protein
MEKEAYWIEGLNESQGPGLAAAANDDDNDDGGGLNTVLL